MWDAYKGNLISSYRGYNAVDEVEAAISCCFSSDGIDVIGGYRNSVKVFKTEIPGRDFISIPTKTPVSAVLSNNNLLALGSWQGAITIYDNREEEWNYVMNFRKYKSGITYLKFLHCQSNILVSGARKNKQLLFWDIRNTTEPILEFSRNVNTNQRIYFDISTDDSCLVSGDTSGIVHAWDITDMSIAKEYKVSYRNLYLIKATVSYFNKNYFYANFNYAPFFYSFQCTMIVVMVSQFIQLNRY